MSRGFNEASDVLKLKKELGHARAQIQDLQDELTEKTNLYIKAISVSSNEKLTIFKQDRDQYREKLNNAKESITKMENIVESKVKLALENERRELARFREENQMLLRKIDLIEAEREADKQKER